MCERANFHRRKSLQELSNPASSYSYYGVPMGATASEAEMLTSASFKRIPSIIFLKVYSWLKRRQGLLMKRSIAHNLFNHNCTLRAIFAKYTSRRDKSYKQMQFIWLLKLFRVITISMAQNSKLPKVNAASD